MLTLLTFSATLFLSAFLLFFIQPMFAKMLLPLLGGAPQVWNTCMVFFQMMLLAGYCYAHILASRVKIATCLLIHAGLMTGALLLLPIHIPPGWVPPPSANPVLSILLLLLGAVGLPFFLISANAPLLQKWFSGTTHPDAGDPYFLYAASNAGSLTALLCYPFWAEPNWTLGKQSGMWSFAYLILIFAVVGCGILMWCFRKPSVVVSAEAENAKPTEVDQITFGKRSKWLLLAFVPSSLLLGVTTFITTDIAAIPLFWVVPLAVYLLTFILAFSRKTDGLISLVKRFFPIIFSVLVAVAAFWARLPFAFIAPWHLICFFLIALILHRELADSRPAPAHLTEFYIWLSLGGMLGGFFNALLAPVLFTSVVEYPLVLVLAAFLWRGVPGGKLSLRHSADLLFTVGLGILVFGGWRLMIQTEIDNMILKGVLLFVFISVPTLAVYASRCRPVRFALFAAAFFITGSFLGGKELKPIYAARSFFGVYQVKVGKDKQSHILRHGNILHGEQSLKPELRKEPLSYFHRTGPIGQVFGMLDKEKEISRVAAVGLGAGSLAMYAGEDQQWTFYELDPLVDDIAHNPDLFTYLQECKAPCDIVLGDGRLSLQKAPPAYFDIMIFDTFSSDAIPIHLITLEAVKLYLNKLASGGLLAFHISNQHLDLEPLFGDLAEALGLAALIQYDRLLERDGETLEGKQPSVWVVLARTPADLGSLTNDARWQRLGAREGIKTVWTDRFSDILSLYRWRWRPFEKTQEMKHQDRNE